MSRRKLYQPHRGGGTDAAVSTTTGPMLAVWGLKSQQMRNFSMLRTDGHQLSSLCIDILTCHDETIRANTVIRLNLNSPSKNPRSATANYISLLTKDLSVQRYKVCIVILLCSVHWLQHGITVVGWQFLPVLQGWPTLEGWSHPPEGDNHRAASYRWARMRGLCKFTETTRLQIGLWTELWTGLDW